MLGLAGRPQCSVAGAAEGDTHIRIVTPDTLRHSQG